MQYRKVIILIDFFIFKKSIFGVLQYSLIYNGKKRKGELLCVRKRITIS